MQISCSAYSEVSPQSVVWAGAQGVRRGVAGAGAAEGEPGRRRAPATRPCAHATVDSAQVCGGASGGVFEREECDLHGTHIWRTVTEFCGRTLLGAGVLCDDGRARRRG